MPRGLGRDRRPLAIARPGRRPDTASVSDTSNDLPVAAVDLGSNSFHMVIAQPDGLELRVLDRVRERVQLAGGLDEQRNLTDEAQERALACLARMEQRLRGVPPERIRAVGTNALRRARNARAFLERARAALGRPIEVISGLEEARLIYLGVADTLPANGARNLVVDIGGGSTECVIGEGFDVIEADSLHMGCVQWTRRFFPSGALKRKAMRRAEIAARAELQTLERRFRALSWDASVGASGTVETAAAVLRTKGWADGTITAAGLVRLRRALLAAGHVRDVRLPGVKPERAAVLPGGLAILLAVFEALGLDALSYSPGALREGVLHDLVGRMRHADVRDRTLQRLVEHYRVDQAQAARVERTALDLWRQARAAWDLEPIECRQMLVRAARLHEVGRVVNYSSHHKHGAYLLRNGHMPGFSNDDQQVLGALVRCHRRKLVRAEVPDLPPLGLTRTLRLCVLLRLAVLLNRGRQPRATPLLLEPAEGRLALAFEPEWLDENPLTRADLEAEQAYLSAHGFRLEVR